MLRCKKQIELTPGFLLLMAGMFYLDQGIGMLPWALVSCMAHEVGHIAAARLLNGKLCRLSLSVVGAELYFEYPRTLSYGEDSMIALAGPGVNLLLGSLACWGGAYPAAVLCLSVGAFNLLPILPLDGGRVMMCFLSAHLQDPWPERIMVTIAGVLAGLLMGAGAVIAIKYANITLLLTAGWIVAGNLKKDNKIKK